MKVAFYLENAQTGDVDLRRPALGNPGCGGTQYLFAALPYYLKQLRGGDCQPAIFANVANRLPENVESVQAADAFEAASKAKELGYDIFVFRPRRAPDQALLQHLDALSLPAVAWAHITPTEPHLRAIARSKAVRAIIYVEQGQHDLAWDSPAWRKSTFIVNGFDVAGFQLPDPPPRMTNLVTYLGALVPQKGFHMLAKVWPEIIAEVPHAQLQVIGSGALYDSSAELGPWGVADREYEMTHIIPHLSGADGSPMPSVAFLGKLGLEKKEILYRTLIGVPNPTGQTENCPGSALEFEACGAAVVSGSHYGMLDTIVHGKTGLLAPSESSLKGYIVRLLQNPEEAFRLGSNGPAFVSGKYDYHAVTNDWIKLLGTVHDGKSIELRRPKLTVDTRRKLPAYLNRALQRAFGQIMEWPTSATLKRFVLGRFRA